MSIRNFPGSGIHLRGGSMDWFPAEKAVFNVWKVSTSLPGRFNLICTMCTAHIHETDLEKTLRLIFMSNFYSKLETNDCYRVLADNVIVQIGSSGKNFQKKFNTLCEMCALKRQVLSSLIL